MPSEYMLKLGDYLFSVSTAAYQEWSHSAEYRWPAQERVGRFPARQYLGPGQEEIGLSGVIYPRYKGGLGQLDRMRGEAGRGKPLMLTEGTGRVWGQWVITRVEETRRLFHSDGTPQRVEFRLQLARYGEERKEATA